MQWIPDNSHKKYAENLGKLACELSEQLINHILPYFLSCVQDNWANYLSNANNGPFPHSDSDGDNDVGTIVFKCKSHRPISTE